MSNLQLSLKKKWFDMTDSGIKKEDYRALTSYWHSRLCLYRGENKSTKWWEDYFDNDYSIDQESRISFKNFDTTTITLGYPKSTDTSRIRVYDHAGIEIRTGNPEWGAEPGKLYFVIKHGKRIK